MKKMYSIKVNVIILILFDWCSLSVGIVHNRSVRQLIDNGDTYAMCEIPEDSAIFTAVECGDSSGCISSLWAPSNSKYQITCPDGKGFAKLNTEFMTADCRDGEWVPNLTESECLQLCPAQEYKTLELECYYRGIEVKCNEMLRPGTTIKVSCKKQYKKQIRVNYVDITECIIGGVLLHDISAECTPVCGIPLELSEAEMLISRGKDTKYAKYPWHVGLYWKVKNKDEIFEFEYQCGGTLIDTNKVLTAAHCIWSTGGVIDPSIVTLAVGKYYSSWNITEESEQKIPVLKIIPGRYYNGAVTKYAQDIAILILNHDVSLNEYVMPACLDLNNIYGGIPKNQLGHVIGWGRLNETIPESSLRLMETEMEYFDLHSCRNKYSNNPFASFLQPDKFCVIYRNGSGTQKGDSGGGMTFTHENLHYVYGVVSIKRPKQDEFAVFTDVLSHKYWIRDILLNCSQGSHFYCKHSSKCIKMESVCNNKKDCVDGSDEDPFLCSSKPSLNVLNITSVGLGCFLPTNSPGDDYEVITGCSRAEDRLTPKCRGVPGTEVEPNTVIVYNCLEGFSLDTDINTVICINGTWAPKIPSCLKMCQPLKSNSLDINCLFMGTRIDCTKKGLRQGTKARLKCKPFYIFSDYRTGADITCVDGKWTNPLPSCKPECGIRNTKPLILPSTVTNAVEYPWYAGLYKYDNKLNSIRPFCSGSIIAPYMILTAAHCVTENTMAIDHTRIKIAVGKTITSWEITEPNEQRFDVARIFVHSDYNEHYNQYAFDIAILELTRNIVIGRGAMPVCMETIPPWTNIEDGALGTVVGWARSENNELSKSLMADHMAYLDPVACRKHAGDLRPFITHDKFCAVHDHSGAGLQQVFSGGLVFQNRENQRYFIRGIMSSISISSNAFATFTNISQETHVDFIRKTERELAPRHEKDIHF